MMADSERNLVDALAQMVAALDDEIEAVRARGRTRTLSFRSGERVRTGPGGHTYRLRLTRAEENLDAVSVAVTTAGSVQGGELLEVRGRDLYVTVARDLGEKVTTGTVDIDPSAILEATADLLGDVAGGEIRADALDTAVMAELVGVSDAPVADDPELTRESAAESEMDSAPDDAEGLDEFQAGAVGTAMRRAGATFVWGPPGTGKTRTLGVLAARLVADGNHVLVCAHSHVAVDTAVLAALAAGCTNVRRLGMPQLAEVPDRVVVDRLGDDDPTSDLSFAVGAGSLTAATLSKVVTAQMPGARRFHHVLIDEASMAQLPQVLLAAGLGTGTPAGAAPVTVFGDIRQLPPVVTARTAAATTWLARDVFSTAGVSDRITNGASDPRLVLLARQYRAHPAIAAVTNGFAYGGRLESDASTQTRDALAIAAPAPGAPVVLWDTASLAPALLRPAGSSRANPTAAVLIAHAAAAACASAGALTAGERLVGIATPYVEQVRVLRALLDDLGRLDEVEVATVHRFQGGERELMFVDCCDARPFQPPPFLKGDEGVRLLNVGTSRARSKLVVVADSSWLRSGPTAMMLAACRREGTVVDAADAELDWASTTEFLERVVADIDAARDDVLVRAPKLRPSGLVDAVRGAAGRGVSVGIVSDADADEIVCAALADAGAVVERLPKRIVERLVVADGVVWTGNTTAPAARVGKAMLRVAAPTFARRLLTSFAASPDAVVQR